MRQHNRLARRPGCSVSSGCCVDRLRSQPKAVVQSSLTSLLRSGFPAFGFSRTTANTSEKISPRISILVIVIVCWPERNLRVIRPAIITPIAAARSPVTRAFDAKNCFIDSQSPGWRTTALGHKQPVSIISSERPLPGPIRPFNRRIFRIRN